VVPDGATVDTSGASWEFPVGTAFAKTFGIDRGSALSPIETRIIFRREAGWDYAAYLWNDDGTDAELLAGNWVEVPKDLEDAHGDPFPYVVPARLDCRTCHETSQNKTGTPVLGMNAFQLPPSLSRSPIFETTARLEPVVGRSERETRALGYFVGNCISCHQGGSTANSVFSLYPGVAVANTVDQPSDISSAEGIRVVPGEPEESVLFLTVVRAREPGYDGPFKAMPPLAITRGDPSAEDILGEWIEGL
jgi:hypothetical protein